MIVTTKDFARAQGISYNYGASLLAFLQARGVAKKTGRTQKVPGKKGKGSTLWEVDTSVPIKLKSCHDSPEQIGGESDEHSQVSVEDDGWNGMDEKTKFRILEGECLVMMNLLLEEDQLVRKVRSGASKKACLDLANKLF